MKTECPAICMKQSAHIFIVYSCLVVENFNLLIKLYIPRGYKIDCATEWCQGVIRLTVPLSGICIFTVYHVPIQDYNF